MKWQLYERRKNDAAPEENSWKSIKRRFKPAVEIEEKEIENRKREIWTSRWDHDEIYVERRRNG